LIKDKIRDSSFLTAEKGDAERFAERFCAATCLCAAVYPDKGGMVLKSPTDLPDVQVCDATAAKK
jgi:hypothetical protein